MLGEWQTHLTFASFFLHIGHALPKLNKTSLPPIYLWEEVDEPAAQQSNLTSEKCKNQGGPPNGHSSKTHHLACQTLNDHGSPDSHLCFSEKLGRYSPPGDFSEAAPCAKAGHWSQRGGIPLNRQPSKDGQHLTPTCVNCQLPTREGAAVGMPLLSWAFITVAERSCSCGLRGMDFKGFFAFEVNPSRPHDEHVPSVV